MKIRYYITNNWLQSINYILFGSYGVLLEKYCNTPIDAILLLGALITIYNVINLLFVPINDKALLD